MRPRKRLPFKTAGTMNPHSWFLFSFPTASAMRLLQQVVPLETPGIMKPNSWFLLLLQTAGAMRLPQSLLVSLKTVGSCLPPRVTTNSPHSPLDERRQLLVIRLWSYATQGSLLSLPCRGSSGSGGSEGTQTEAIKLHKQHKGPREVGVDGGEGAGRGTTGPLLGSNSSIIPPSHPRPSCHTHSTHTRPS